MKICSISWSRICDLNVRSLANRTCFKTLSMLRPMYELVSCSGLDLFCKTSFSRHILMTNGSNFWVFQEYAFFLSIRNVGKNHRQS